MHRRSCIGWLNLKISCQGRADRQQMRPFRSTERDSRRATQDRDPGSRKPKCLPRLPRPASRSCHGSTLLFDEQNSGETVSFHIFLSGASCRTCVVSGKAPTSRGVSAWLEPRESWRLHRQQEDVRGKLECRGAPGWLEAGGSFGSRRGVGLYTPFFTPISPRSLRRGESSAWASSPRGSMAREPILERADTTKATTRGKGNPRILVTHEDAPHGARGR